MNTIAQARKNMRLLEILSRNFGNSTAAAAEIINLEAIMSLPKGTEHFVADIHGEHEAFIHILKNASGNIKRKVKELFGATMRDEEIRQLCTLIYYPARKLADIKQSECNMNDFYMITLHRLVRVLQRVSEKYTRSKVRKALPKQYAYIIEELLHESGAANKQSYYHRIIETIIETGQADDFIKAMGNVIQRLSIDHLHILGDVYDRGPGAHLIMDRLSRYRNYDIQWGNHDALWMGAAAGNVSSIANVLRISLRYANMATLEDGYGINLVPLASFAMDVYGDDPCTVFLPKVEFEDTEIAQKNRLLTARMHKAISIIQWKLEHDIIARHPEWDMGARDILHTLDRENGTVTIEGRVFEMPEMNFPTVDPADPYRLTEEEASLVEKLVNSFRGSDKLRKHIEIMFSHGSMYACTNNNLLFHASVPLNEDGSFKEVKIGDKSYKGRALLDKVDILMRQAFDPAATAADREFAIDYYWYLWCGADSPLFDKSKMATFERYFLTDKAIRHEEKGHYYHLREQADICDKILREFGLEAEHGHIINGHVPVKASKGETPVKADGKMMVIDGGFSKAYHDTTGIAGYTLVYHSRGFQLVQHDPFTSAEDAVKRGTDIVSTTQIVEFNAQRLNVRDTDIGRDLLRQIEELKLLLTAFRAGLIKERF
ncbi:MAG: fructose-1,6-bisphosphatase [Porphyromonadaceae bacterium]|nr:fructose-1,6-bisphosphatase [Porphyromonadaceae bacterium]MDD6314984.1 fructose-1,6-bisphosphatase [Porphyromonadaceae bacterium]